MIVAGDLPKLNKWHINKLMCAGETGKTFKPESNDNTNSLNSNTTCLYVLSVDGARESNTRPIFWSTKARNLAEFWSACRRARVPKALPLEPGTEKDGQTPHYVCPQYGQC